jgi:hypothetical protein
VRGFGSWREEAHGPFNISQRFFKSTGFFYLNMPFLNENFRLILERFHRGENEWEDEN